MKKLLLARIFSSLLTGCAPGYVSTPVSINSNDHKLQEVKIKYAEFAQKVKSINLETADTGSKPGNYKRLVEEAIREQLKAPDSAKFSGMTSPRKELIVKEGDFIYGYSTCVYVNAKNSYGGYVGKQLYWIFLRNNQVLRVQNTNDAYGDIIFVDRPVNCT